LVASLGFLFCPTRSTNIIQFGRTLRGYCFLLCFSVTRLGPWCIDIALLFDNPVVHGCLLVACLVLFAWGLCTAALLCLVCLIVGGQFRTITCRQIRLAHSSVCQGSHTLAHPSDLRLGKGCKTLLSLSLSVGPGTCASSDTNAKRKSVFKQRSFRTQQVNQHTFLCTA